MPRQTNKKPIPFKPVMPPSAPITLNKSTLFQSMKDGFGFGIGSTMARNFLTPAHTPEKIQNEIHEKLTTSIEKKQEFMQCMEKTQNYDECLYHLE